MMTDLSIYYFCGRVNKNKHSVCGLWPDKIYIERWRIKCLMGGKSVW